MSETAPVQCEKCHGRGQVPIILKGDCADQITDMCPDCLGTGYLPAPKQETLDGD